MATVRSAPSLLAQATAKRDELRDVLGISGGAASVVQTALVKEETDTDGLTYNFTRSVVSVVSVDVNGITQAADEWTFSEGTGPDGVSQLVFGETPGNAPVEALINI